VAFLKEGELHLSRLQHSQECRSLTIRKIIDMEWTLRYSDYISFYEILNIVKNYEILDIVSRLFFIL